MTKASKYFKATTAVALAVSAVAVAAPAMTEASTFKDLNISQYFYNDVLNLNERGIIKGFEDGTFKPGNSLTRGQAAKIIAGVLQLDTTEVTNPNFKDIPTSHQYYCAIAALKQAGIIDGYEDGTFRQSETIQRNHVAKILTNALNLKATNVEALPFTDMRPDYKEAIAALYENNITTGKTATTFDGSSKVTRGQFAAFIARAEKVGNVEQTISFNVEDYTATTIVIDGVTYTYASEVAAMFTEANIAALANAKVMATVKDGVITKVNALTLNAAGTEEAPISFEAKATVETLVINADYVSVKDVTVTGDTTFTTNVENSIELEAVIVNGDIIVDDAMVGAVASVDNAFAKTAKKGPKLNFKNIKAKRIHVKRNDVAIHTSSKIGEISIGANVTAINLNGAIEKVSVASTTAIEISGTANVGELVLKTTAKVSLNLIGIIALLVAQNTDAKIIFALTVKVDELSLPAGTSAQAMIENFAQAAQQILAILVGNTTVGGATGGTTSNGSTPGNAVTTTKDSAQAKITSINIDFDDTLTYVKVELKSLAPGTKGFIRIYAEKKLIAEHEVTVDHNELYTKFENLGDGEYTLKIAIANLGGSAGFKIETSQPYQLNEVKTLINTIRSNYLKVSETGKDIEVNSRWITPAEQQKLEAVVAEAEALLVKIGVKQAELNRITSKLNMTLQDYELNAQFGEMQESSSSFNPVMFTFNSSITTADIATIDTIKINGTTADTATATTGDTFTLTFGQNATVSTMDVIEFIVTNKNGDKVPFPIRYENNEWKATLRQEQ